MTTPRILSLMLVVVSACSQAERANDSTLADLPVDTMKPVLTRGQEDSIRRADSIRVADSVAAARAARPATKSTGTRTTPTKTAPTGTKRDSLSPNIGRDSVIRRPLGRLPADTTG